MLFAEYQPVVKPDPTNKASGSVSAISPPNDLPYPVCMFEKKYQTDVDKNTTEASCTNLTVSDLAGTFDQKYNFQIADSDELFTSTPGDNVAPVKCQFDEEKNMQFMMDSKDNVPKPMDSIVFTDATPRSCPAKSDDVLSITSMKREETDATKDLDSATSHCKASCSSDTEFSCGLGARSFKQDLKSHVQIRTDEKPYKCNECNKSFQSQWHLNRHCHDDKSYKCNVCGKSFTYKSYLTTHSRIHSGERPYECDVCGKTNSQNTHLKEHYRMHTGERPYECNLWKNILSELSSETARSNAHW